MPYLVKCLCFNVFPSGFFLVGLPFHGVCIQTLSIYLFCCFLTLSFFFFLYLAVSPGISLPLSRHFSTNKFNSFIESFRLFHPYFCQRCLLLRHLSKNVVFTFFYSTAVVMQTTLKLLDSYKIEWSTHSHTHTYILGLHSPEICRFTPTQICFFFVTKTDLLSEFKISPKFKRNIRRWLR